MSHDSGFRRSDHDSTHRPAMMRRPTTKASQHFEDRLRRKREQRERLRQLIEAKKADQ